MLLEHGAHVVVGDVNEPPIQNSNLSFLKTDVTAWSDLSALFKAAKHQHGRINHVFANAGISGRTTYLDEQFDDKGDLKEPNDLVYQINQKGCINTCTLALHYLRQQEGGGSIVVTASASSFQRFRIVDYTIAKHAVLGIVRGLAPLLHPTLPIRINAISPSWTSTGLVPKDFVESVGGVKTQPPEAVARSVAILMADPARHGQLIYSVQGRYSEIEDSILRPAAVRIVGEVDEDLVCAKLQAAAAGFGATAKSNE